MQSNASNFLGCRFLLVWPGRCQKRNFQIQLALLAMLAIVYIPPLTEYHKLDGLSHKTTGNLEPPLPDIDRPASSPYWKHW
jgi:hypothetical protein